MVTLVRQAGPAFTLHVYTHTTTTSTSRSDAAIDMEEPRSMHGRPAGCPDLARPCPADCRGQWPPALYSVRQRFPHSLLQPPLSSAPCYARCSLPLAAAFLPSLTVTSPPSLCLLLQCCWPSSLPRLQSSIHADSMLRQGQEPLCHMDGALLLASLVRLVWSGLLTFSSSPRDFFKF